MIQDFYEGFQEGLREFQAIGEGLILVGVENGKGMSLWISLRRGFNTEVLRRGLENLMIDTNNIWIK